MLYVSLVMQGTKSQLIFESTMLISRKHLMCQRYIEKKGSKKKGSSTQLFVAILFVIY